MAEHSRRTSSRYTTTQGSDSGERRTQQSRSVSERKRSSGSARTTRNASQTRNYRSTAERERARTTRRQKTEDYYDYDRPRITEPTAETTERTLGNRQTTQVRARVKERQKEKPKKGRKRNFLRRIVSVRNGMDIPFFLLIVVLLIIGVTMMFSASYAYSYYNNGGKSYHYLLRQAIFAVSGVVLMVLISLIDYHELYRFRTGVLLIAFVLLGVVLIMPARNGVHRWIDVGDWFSFQASEIMKFAVVLFYARQGHDHFQEMGTFRHGVKPAVLIGLGAGVLLFMEPHYSCIVIIFTLLLLMMFVSGVRIRWFAFGGVLLATGFLVLQVTGNLKYAQERLDGWGLALEENLSSDMQWKVWQTMNSLYAIGSGGLTGLGLGQSREKYLYLPEPQNDFVFAVVVEELGFIGGVIILLIFMGLIVRGIMISLKARDKFGMLLGIGLVSQIGIQVLINILVITDTLPNTGISLPFFSYGGTSLWMLLGEMGVVLSISRSASIEKN